MQTFRNGLVLGRKRQLLNTHTNPVRLFSQYTMKNGDVRLVVGLSVTAIICLCWCFTALGEIDGSKSLWSQGLGLEDVFSETEAVSWETRGRFFSISPRDRDSLSMKIWTDLLQRLSERRQSKHRGLN